ncbi:hypothetical protein [Amycolatopsis marina]|uniref:hypothetical protein n=1 Tax=Amycolatopsis marina TaxID=490629 RepID=UPI0011608726|nr:hypothetical protein [Amycolatopsis marina]
MIVHVLVLFPLCATVERGLLLSSPRLAVTVLNHLRVPALASGLLFVLFFPEIIEHGSRTYQAATGQK